MANLLQSTDHHIGRQSTNKHIMNFSSLHLTALNIYTFLPPRQDETIHLKYLNLCLRYILLVFIITSISWKKTGEMGNRLVTCCNNKWVKIASETSKVQISKFRELVSFLPDDMIFFFNSQIVQSSYFMSEHKEADLEFREILSLLNCPCF